MSGTRDVKPLDRDQEYPNDWFSLENVFGTSLPFLDGSDKVADGKFFTRQYFGRDRGEVGRSPLSSFPR